MTMKAKNRYEYEGRMLSVREISNETGIPRQTIYWRVQHDLPPVDESLIAQAREAKTAEDDYKPLPMPAEDELDIGGCWLLAASVLRYAYEDAANYEMLEILRDDPNYSKNIIHKKNVMIRQAERSVINDLKGRECTDEELQKMASRRLISKMKQIEQLGKAAERFFESDRAIIFCWEADPKAILERSRERVRLWADGKIQSYHLKGNS